MTPNDGVGLLTTDAVATCVPDTLLLVLAAAVAVGMPAEGEGATVRDAGEGLKLGDGLDEGASTGTATSVALLNPVPMYVG